MMTSAVMPQLSSEATMMTHANTIGAPPADGAEEGNLPNVQRSNKPRPLKLENPGDKDTNVSKSVPGPGFNFNQPVQPMNQDELLDLMNRINSGVKSGQFTSQLAQYIFRLYQQLKLFGDKIEQQNKNELNRVFVSLRQACCRDSGQLGTPCRLKIMELVELRAMGWRPNLAHSQYYLNRTMTNGETQLPTGGGTQHAHAHQQQQPVAIPQQNQQAHAMDFEQAMMAAPISAPPFGSVPMNPFAFAPPSQHHHQPMVTHHMATHHQEHMQQAMTGQPAVSQAAPSYYLIPASGAIFPHPAPPISMMPPPSPLGGPPMGFAMPPPMQQAPPTSMHQQVMGGQYQAMNVAQSLMTTSGGMEQQQQASPPESETPWPRGAVVKPSAKFTQPQKVPGKNMFRDEIVIRNADSGKIMGVKGRRVAVVEEISKTIISFQKVPQGVKERTLTITGNSEDTIERAKILIEETIRRNVSPARPEGEGDDQDTEETAAATVEPLALHGTQEDGATHDHVPDAAQGVPGEAITDAAASFFELTNDSGVLKLSCADPEMLAAAQDALNAYFKRTTPLRRSQGSGQTEKQLKAERRKSMPSFSPESGGSQKGGGGRRQSPTRPIQPCPPEEILSWRRRDPPNPPEDTPDQSGRGVSDSPKAQQQNNSKQANRRDNGAKQPLPRKQQQHQTFAKSTPNLSAANAEKDEKENKDSETEPKSQLQMRVLYTRDYLLQCTASPLAHISPGSVPKIQKEAPEILRETNAVQQQLTA